MRSQKGVALLVVLMILAIMAALASEMTLRYQINIRRTGYTQQQLQQNWLVGLAEHQAMQILAQDLRDNAKLLTRDQLWAQPQQRELASGNTVSWQLTDRQACFNVNALVNTPTDAMADVPASVRVFTALLANLDVTGAPAEALIDAIADYIDSDETPRRSGAENEYYRTSRDPHTIGGRRLYSVSELRQIKGMTPALYQRLVPFVCALPNDELKINISTLTREDAPLLAAMLDNMLSVSDVRALFDKQKRQNLASPAALKTALEKTFPGRKDELEAFKNVAATTSQYFRLQTTVSLGDSRSGTISELEFDTKTSQLFITARRRAAVDR